MQLAFQCATGNNRVKKKKTVDCDNISVWAAFLTKLCAVFFSFPGLQTFRVLTLRSLLFRDFDVIKADEPARSMF
jgi:hypothetical protein